MNIGFYHGSAGTRHASGIAVYVQNMAAELSNSNDVYLYTRRGELSELLLESDVTVVETRPVDGRLVNAIETLTPLETHGATQIAMALQSRRNGVVDHVDEHVDILFCQLFLDDLLLSNFVDVSTVYGLHRFDNVGVGGRLRAAFSRTELLVANSRDTARRVREVLGHDVDEIVYPGVDTERFRPDVEPAFSSDVPVVLFVGRLVDVKGIYDLLEAFSTIEEPACLYVVGAGDTERVEERCRELGVRESVTLAGEVPHLELPGYYAAADVFCLPSRSESFGMANVEAMACGTPVVTSDLEAVRTYVTDGENGLLVRPGDPRDLAAKLETLVSSADRRADMGERTRDRALEFSWDRQAAKLERFCADVLGESDGRSTVRPERLPPDGRVLGRLVDERNPKTHEH